MPKKQSSSMPRRRALAQRASVCRMVTPHCYERKESAVAFSGPSCVRLRAVSLSLSLSFYFLSPIVLYTKRAHSVGSQSQRLPVGARIGVIVSSRVGIEMRENAREETGRVVFTSTRGVVSHIERPSGCVEAVTVTAAAREDRTSWQQIVNAKMRVSESNALRVFRHSTTETADTNRCNTRSNTSR